MEIFADYARGFYSPECDWTRWVVSVQASEAERIVNIAPGEKRANVITNGFSPMLLRYHLRREGQGWLICDVDTVPCLLSEGQKRRLLLVWRNNMGAQEDPGRVYAWQTARARTSR